ncbi:MAG: ferritin-like domain-containing protein [Verrucomicrobiales bacterium]
MMKLELIEDFYLEQLRDLADAEKQLLKALPKMAKAAVSPELRQAFEFHTRETEEQLKRLESIFKSRNESLGGKSCAAMKGLIEEAEEFLEEDAAEELIDVGLVTAAQKIEHYEIASYGCVNEFACLLQLDDEAKLLHQTLTEEKATDGKLTVMAQTFLNEEAAQGEMPGQDEVDDDSGNALSGEGRSANRSSGGSSGSKGNKGAGSAAKESQSRSTEPRSKRQHKGDDSDETAAPALPQTWKKFASGLKAEAANRFT